MDCLVSERYLTLGSSNSVQNKISERKKKNPKDFHGTEDLNVKLFPESSRIYLGIFKTKQKREIW